MDPGFIAEEECMKHQNITTCVATKPLTKLLFLVNQLILTRVKLKFCIGTLWNKQRSVWYVNMCVRPPVVPVTVMIWWGVP